MTNSEKLDYDHILALMNLISQTEANSKTVNTDLLRQQLDKELHLKPVRYDLNNLNGESTESGNN